MTLPDGQTVRAVVTRRRRDRSGTWWWYAYQLTLLGRVDTAHGPIPQPHVVDLSAPHPIVQPIGAQDDTALDPPPQKRTRWRVDVTRDGRRLVHRMDGAAGSEGGSLATDADALRRLAQGPEAAVMCAVRRPEAVLRALPEPADDSF
ncbi:hypothetical protein ACFYWU_40550 [Streptomyces chrestomyceticus]|uniref:hypothetical protein n=1 Tax=Streptomyces chrestomyceticus TaxID=68185 RepID=UPI003696B637